MVDLFTKIRLHGTYGILTVLSDGWNYLDTWLIDQKSSVETKPIMYLDESIKLENFLGGGWDVTGVDVVHTLVKFTFRTIENPRNGPFQHDMLPMDLISLMKFLSYDGLDII